MFMCCLWHCIPPPRPLPLKKHRPGSLPAHTYTTSKRSPTHADVRAQYKVQSYHGDLRAVTIRSSLYRACMHWVQAAQIFERMDSTEELTTARKMLSILGDQ